MASDPSISVVIVCYKMDREIVRTVESFNAPYQQGMRQDEIEILVMNNSAKDPIPAEIRAEWPSNVRYIEVPNPPPSPARALNLGAKMARGQIICPVIDGARMASPGLLRYGRKALKSHGAAFVATTGFHLGSERQQIAVLSGYDQKTEDALLDSINWPKQGYRLFEIAAMGGSAKAAWFGQMSESNAPLLTSGFYDKLGGYDEAFDTPGGGLVNLDFFKRAVDIETVPFVLLIGEGTFHQFHGGVTTSRNVREVEADGRTTFERYQEQYQAIRGERFRTPRRRPLLYGIQRGEWARLSSKAVNTLLADHD
ncbi:MAG: glycosyltransferase family A protein [Pseudomonadota bacterium]